MLMNLRNPESLDFFLSGVAISNLFDQKHCNPSIKFMLEIGTGLPLHCFSQTSGDCGPYSVLEFDLTRSNPCLECFTFEFENGRKFEWRQFWIW